MFLPDQQGHSCASAAGTQTVGPPATPLRVRACSWVGDARKGLRDDIRDSCLCPQVTGTSPGTHLLMRMLGSLGLAWDDDWISLSFGDGVYLVGITMERKCEQKNLTHWGPGPFPWEMIQSLLTGLAGKDGEVERWSVPTGVWTWLLRQMVVPQGHFSHLCWICLEPCGHGEEPSYHLYPGGSRAIPKLCDTHSGSSVLLCL